MLGVSERTQKWYEFCEQLPQMDGLHVGILHPSPYILCADPLHKTRRQFPR